MNTLRSVSSNTFWQIASKAINSLSGLIILGLIQRYYGIYSVGLYTLILGYVGFFFVPVDFGLNAIAVKHLLQKEKNSVFVFRNLLGLRLLLGFVITIIALIILQFLPYDQNTQTGYTGLVKTGILISSITILVQAVLATTNAYFQAKLKYKYSFIGNTTSAVLNTILICYFVLNSAPLLMLLLAFSISGITGAVSVLILVRKFTKSMLPSKNLKYWKELLYETLPLTISLVLNLIYFRIDTLILPLYRSLQEVGQYNVAYKLFDTALVLPNYFSNALYPVLIQKWNLGVTPFIKVLKKSALALSALAIAGTLTTYFLADLVIYIILGTYDHSAALYLKILTSGLIFFFLSSISMWGLIVIGKQKYLSFIYGITMVINIISNLILIPKLGALASAYITLVTEILVLIFSGSLLIFKLKKIVKQNETN